MVMLFIFQLTYTASSVHLIKKLITSLNKVALVVIGVIDLVFGLLDGGEDAEHNGVGLVEISLP